MENQSDSKTKETDIKKKRPTRKFDHSVHIIRTAITNAMKPGPFRVYVETFGYNITRIDQGLSLLESAESARTTQVAANDLKKQKTREVTGLRQKAHKLYASHRLIGTEEFRDQPFILDTLGFTQKRRQDFGGWLALALRLYENTSLPGVGRVRPALHYRRTIGNRKTSGAIGTKYRSRTKPGECGSPKSNRDQKHSS